MSVLHAVLALVVAQRLAELVYARRNTRRLLAQGGFEIDAGGYWMFVALHASWLAALILFIAPTKDPFWLALAAYAALQPIRLWAIMSLGPYWTTRLISVPRAPLIQTGPYRYLRHPNYVVVVGEIALLPVAFAAWEIAGVFSVLNLILLYRRITMENQLLIMRP